MTHGRHHATGRMGLFVIVGGKLCISSGNRLGVLRVTRTSAQKPLTHLRRDTLQQNTHLYGLGRGRDIPPRGPGTAPAKRLSNRRRVGTVMTRGAARRPRPVQKFDAVGTCQSNCASQALQRKTRGNGQQASRERYTNNVNRATLRKSTTYRLWRRLDEDMQGWIELFRILR